MIDEFERGRDHVVHLIEKAGHVARPDFPLIGKGSVHATTRSGMDIFRVAMTFGEDSVRIGIIREGEADRDGWPAKGGRFGSLMPDRCFTQRYGNTTDERRARSLFSNALNAELARHRPDPEPGMDADELGERLKALIEADPENAGRIIAEAISLHGSPDLMASIAESIEADHPSP